ncbi:class I SAM-dependent methyltransferase [Imhoffiella purpurea]|uniref:Methyltransferase, putative n=1 Tax=Imhoffiella purpurea TaxID=1249627 RepID=W9W3C8_9GAMM|nr:class I SAM-dependent methyltransferase [Imhoffiella purpurea]EXJ17075.1 methyltransferase, putative [Imhoffiella purpurea]
MSNPYPRTDFEQAAPTWDENPLIQELARAVRLALADHCALRPGMRVLDYGCGTGLAALALAAEVAEVEGWDSSPAMLAELEAKRLAAGVDNLHIRRVDLVDEPAPASGFDLIHSAMALHHVPDVAAMIERFADLLVPGGMLFLVDLDLEDGSFHADHEGVCHHGFDRERIAEMLAAAGLEQVRVETAHRLVKPDTDGVERRYSMFGASAVRG